VHKHDQRALCLASIFEPAFKVIRMAPKIEDIEEGISLPEAIRLLFESYSQNRYNLPQ
jgi:hypothetical protein